MSRWKRDTPGGSRDDAIGSGRAGDGSAVSPGAGPAFSPTGGEVRRPPGAAPRPAAAFEDAKFGLFIHWGVYSLAGQGRVGDGPRQAARSASTRSCPLASTRSKFDADAWVKLAKAAGAKYITITSKHHDGFCMFASRLTDYDIVDATPYHATRSRPWPTPAINRRSSSSSITHCSTGTTPTISRWARRAGPPVASRRGTGSGTLLIYQGQVRELCTNYGEIGGIWFDGWWDRPDADWDLAGTYRLIHELQPGALVGNNHHVAPFPGEDFQMFEQDLPGENAAGFNKAGVAAELPLETCLTINRSWGYNAGDTDWTRPPSRSFMPWSAPRGAAPTCC